MLVLKRLDASLIGGGKIGQVVSTHTDTESQMSSSTFADVSGCLIYTSAAPDDM